MGGNLCYGCHGAPRNVVKLIAPTVLTLRDNYGVGIAQMIASELQKME